MAVTALTEHEGVTVGRGQYAPSAPRVYVTHGPGSISTARLSATAGRSSDGHHALHPSATRGALYSTRQRSPSR